MEKFILIFGLLLFYFGVPFSNAQTESVSGTVTDAQTDELLPGVNISIKGTTAGTSTNTNGEYELSVKSLQDTLIFSFIGYQTKEVPIQGRNNIDVSLNPKAILGEELVVTALGIERQEKSVGTSTQNIGSKELESSPSVGVANKLSGQASGLKVVSSSGQPGSSSRVVIRGENSITGNNEPLYVLDGIPISSGTFGNPSDDPFYSGGGSSRSLDIDPAIIENISVLKGGAASALYGSRASNGVILMSTK